MSASCSTLRRITVVLICTGMPSSTSIRTAASVSRRCPATPRTPSCVSASAPSRLIDTVFAPTSRIRRATSRVSSGVTLGAKPIGIP